MAATTETITPTYTVAQAQKTKKFYLVRPDGKPVIGKVYHTAAEAQVIADLKTKALAPSPMVTEPPPPLSEAPEETAPERDDWKTMDVKVARKAKAKTQAAAIAADPITETPTAEGMPVKTRKTKHAYVTYPGRFPLSLHAPEDDPEDTPMESRPDSDETQAMAEEHGLAIMDAAKKRKARRIPKELKQAQVADQRVAEFSTFIQEAHAEGVTVDEAIQAKRQAHAAASKEKAEPAMPHPSIDGVTVQAGRVNKVDCWRPCVRITTPTAAYIKLAPKQRVLKTEAEESEAWARARAYRDQILASGELPEAGEDHRAPKVLPVLTTPSGSERPVMPGVTRVDVE